MTYEETLIVAQKNIKDSLVNGGSLVFEFIPIETRRTEDIINAAIAAFSEKDLRLVRGVSFRVLHLTTVPNNLRYFKNLIILDLSYTNIKILPPWLIEFRKLQRLDLLGTEIKKLPASLKKMDWLLQLDLRHTALSLPNKNIFKHSGYKKKLYSLLYKRLDILQNKINICDWHEVSPGAGEKQFACLNSERQCCHHEWECTNLCGTGCAVDSLSCKLWLCNDAVERLRMMRAEKNKPELRSTARRYYNMRIATDLLCKVLNVPIKLRAGKAESFDKETGDFVNTKIKHWYDGIVLYPRGVYPGRL
jgi:hypothetical protein